MSEMPRQKSTFRFLDRTQLLKLRAKAMRSGVWFKALQRIDRVLVDLTIRVASNIRSVTLANSILTVTQKLHELLESDFSRTARSIGFPMARNLSKFAQEWGNKNAENWASDKSFIRYLTVMTLYSHPSNG